MPTQRGRAWRQFLRSRLALPGALIVLAFILVAMLAPWLTPWDPVKTDLGAALQAPSSVHWFGTDDLGRDIFSRVLYGSRFSLTEGLMPVALALAVGVPLGIASGFFGGWLDQLLMRLIDILMAFPGVLLAIAVVSVLGPTLINAMIAVAIYTVPVFARLARATTLTVVAEPYIEACRATGTGVPRILARHVFPNIAPTILVMAALRVAISILTVSSLSFLGLGAQPPTPEWGAMLANGRNYLLVAPNAVLFPALAIIVLIFGLNMFQDGLRVALDPRARGR